MDFGDSKKMLGGLKETYVCTFARRVVTVNWRRLEAAVDPTTAANIFWSAKVGFESRDARE